MSRFDRVRPALAALCAACVLALGCAAFFPELHSWLCASETASGPHHVRGRAASKKSHHHHAEPLPDDHVCAVTLFATGTDLTQSFVVTPPPTFPDAEPAAFSVEVRRRTLLGPHRTCGPPELKDLPVAALRVVA